MSVGVYIYEVFVNEFLDLTRFFLVCVCVCCLWVIR